jgi:N-ethylmaleimide reductase
MSTDLFQPYDLGPITLRNRLVMAPMTRSRAVDGVPTELMASYYAQRAGAGLIITEGTAPSPDGLGYPRIPGLYTEAQAEAWSRVTAAVHRQGGRIFVQLMHTGRIGHHDNLPAGAELVAPSAVAAAGEMYTDTAGNQPHPTPRAMSREDVEAAIGEFVRSARLARQAGFDGVELHGANGYLIDQFLNPHSNRRQDDYGGSPERRNRFAIEVAAAVAEAIGADRTGIRLSPYGVFNDLGIYEGIEQQYSALAERLSALGLAYIHLVDHSSMGAPEPEASTVQAIRERFDGTLILSGGYDRDRAQADLQQGQADLIAFGRPFLANPDLVERLQRGEALNPPDYDTFYTPGERGYIDYPTLKARAQAAK